MMNPPEAPALVNVAAEPNVTVPSKLPLTNALPAASTAGHDVAIAFDKLKGPYRDAAAPSTPSLPEHEYAGACDLVVANILAGPLLALAPAIARLAKPGGALALSGVLVAQADDVCAAFRDAGFADARVAEEREGWVLIEGTYRET